MKNDHLDPNRLDLALADPERLDAQDAAHLAECPGCRDRLRDLSDDLARFSRAAGTLVPDVRVRIRLPADRRPRFRLLVLAPALAAAAAVLVLSVVFFRGGPEPMAPENTAPVRAAFAPDPEMAEALSLAETDPAQDYLDMVEAPDEGSIQGFLEFAVPAPEDDLQGRRAGKGGFPC